MNFLVNIKVNCKKILFIISLLRKGSTIFDLQSYVFFLECTNFWTKKHKFIGVFMLLFHQCTHCVVNFAIADNIELTIYQPL